MLVSGAENVSLGLSFCYTPIANTRGVNESTTQRWVSDPLSVRPSHIPISSNLAGLFSRQPALGILRTRLELRQLQTIVAAPPPRHPFRRPCDCGSRQPHLSWKTSLQYKSWGTLDDPANISPRPRVGNTYPMGFSRKLVCSVCGGLDWSLCEVCGL